MKIRIRGNSLRLRLVKSEVTRFAESGVLEERISFGAGSLRYALEVFDGAAIATSFDGQSLCVRIPRAEAASWASSDAVSLVGEEATEGGVLKLLIEKDFACINPSAVWQEDQSDNYENPHLSCGVAHK